MDTHHGCNITEECLLNASDATQQCLPNASDATGQPSSGRGVVKAPDTEFTSHLLVQLAERVW